MLVWLLVISERDELVVVVPVHVLSVLPLLLSSGLQGVDGTLASALAAGRPLRDRVLLVLPHLYDCRGRALANSSLSLLHHLQHLHDLPVFRSHLILWHRHALDILLLDPLVSLR